MTVRVSFEADNIHALRAAMTAFFDDTAPAPERTQSDPAAPAPRRGRPPKAAATASADEFKPITPQPADAVAEEKAAAVESGAVQLSKQMLQEVLINVVKKHGRDACGALCRKHGGPNLSALSTDVYPALYADAQAVLSQDVQA